MYIRVPILALCSLKIQASSAILGRQIFYIPMVKKSKKKTIESTKKKPQTEEKSSQKNKKPGFFAGLFGLGKKQKKKGESKLSKKERRKLEKEKAKAEAEQKKQQAKEEAKKLKAEEEAIKLAAKEKELKAKAEKMEKELQKAQEKEQKAQEEVERLKFEEFEAEEKRKAAEAKAAEVIERSATKDVKKTGRRQFSPEQKRKIKGGILSLIGLFVLLYIGIFLLGKIFRPQALADFLPSSGTVGLVEIAIDPDAAQVKNFFEVMKKYPVYQQEGLARLINFVFPVDFKQDLAPWIGRKIGIILMRQSADDNSLKLVLFIENKSTEKALAFFKDRILNNSQDELINEKYSNFDIYSFKQSQNYNFTFISNYVVVSANKDLLKQLVDEQVSPTLRLRDEQNYRRIADNLPQGALAFTYINMSDFYSALFKNPVIKGQKAKDLLELQPFLNVFSTEGMTVFAEDKKFKMQVFTNVDRQQLEGKGYLSYSDKYQGELLNLLGENPLMFFGGHNLYKELIRISEVFQTGTSPSEQIFQAILETQKQKYFGKDVSLQTDIYPLLTNEYLLNLDIGNENPIVNVAIKLNTVKTDAEKIEKLTQAFTKTSAIFTPKVQVVTLPDGSTGQEIIADPEEILRTNTTYDGNNITTLALGDLPWSIHYTIIDNIWIISTDRESLQKMIDRKMGKQQASLIKSNFYQQTIEPLIRSADEVMHVKLIPVFALLNWGEGTQLGTAIKPYLEPFNSLTMSKNFFEDGISTMYVLDVL